MVKRLTLKEKLKRARLKVIRVEEVKIKRRIKSLMKLIKRVRKNKNVADRLRMKLDTERKILAHLRSKK